MMQRIPILDGFYEITDDGRLYSVRSKKYLRPNLDKHGYYYYVISINGVRETHKAHRLVAQAYIANPGNKPTVNHINGIRTDNRVLNLEWATPKEQANDPLTKVNVAMVHAQTDYRAMGAKRNFGRKTTFVSNESGFLGQYASLKEAATACGVSCSKASECANHHRASAGGFVFSYA